MVADFAPVLLEHLFHQMPLGIHLYDRGDPTEDRAFRLREANPASAHLLKVPVEEILGRRIEEIFVGARAMDLREVLADVLRSSTPAAFEDVHDRGDPRSAVAFAFKVFPASEGRIGVLFEDISVRWREEEGLRDRVSFLSAIIHHIPLPVFVKEAKELRCLEMNQAGVDFCGIPLDIMLGKHDAEYLPEELAARLNEVDRRVLAGREILDIPEELIPGHAGDLRIMHTRKVPVLDKQGVPRFLLGISEDITERRRAEDGLRKSERELVETQQRLRETISELLTPVLPIHDGLLVVPLIGYVDSQRSDQFTGALLSSIERHQAEIVIIDITGVPLMDAAVASHLLRAVRAAELLGAHCVMVGLSPRLAQRLVQLGVDLGALVLRRDLQAGVAYALNWRGRTRTAARAR